MMLHFTFGEPAAFHLTLSELTTLENPAYLFIFERRLPGETIAFVLRPDSSSRRSDSFVVDVDSAFFGQKTGQYAYRVYEQEDEENIDPALAVGEIEHGVMELHPEVNFSYIAREQTIAFSQR